MVFTLLVLTAAFVGMVGSSASPLREDDAQAAPFPSDDPDAGFRGFGKVVMVFTLVASLIFVLLLIAMFLSIGGVWEHDSIDPPV